jgi:hypothetical protein
MKIRAEGAQLFHADGQTWRSFSQFFLRAWKLKHRPTAINFCKSHQISYTSGTTVTKLRAKRWRSRNTIPRRSIYFSVLHSVSTGWAAPSASFPLDNEQNSSGMIRHGREGEGTILCEASSAEFNNTRSSALLNQKFARCRPWLATRKNITKSLYPDNNRIDFIWIRILSLKRIYLYEQNWGR